MVDFVRTGDYDILAGVLLAVTGCEALFAKYVSRFPTFVLGELDYSTSSQLGPVQRGIHSYILPERCVPLTHFSVPGTRVKSHCGRRCSDIEYLLQDYSWKLKWPFVLVRICL